MERGFDVSGGWSRNRGFEVDEKFGRTPASCAGGGVVGCWCEGGAWTVLVELFAETKVGDDVSELRRAAIETEVVSCFDEDVLWFQVSVNKLEAVKMLNTFCDLRETVFLVKSFSW